MPTFEYKALQPDGQLNLGRLEAPGRQEALRQLQARGLQPVRLAELEDSNGAPAARNGSSGPAGLPWQRRRVSFSMLEDFTRSLSSLLSAGVPLSRALSILHREATHPVAAAQWKKIHDLVIDGVSLAGAMAQSPETFPRVYTAMVEAGETGGFLDLVLAQIADFQAREKELRAKVSAALIYPAVLLTLAIGVLIFLLTFFIPRFQKLFEGFDANLPWLTQMIVGASQVLRSYGLFVAAGLVVLVVLGRQYLASDAGRRRWEKFLLETPVLGNLMARLAMARFCRMLGTLLQAGVPLIAALNVARRSLGYQTLADATRTAIDRVRQGDSLADSLAECRLLFPGSTLEMIRVAEESSRLDTELVRLADVNERALDRQLKTAVALLEPLMLFVIAGFIGTIFIGMVIPIFTIQDYIK